MKLMTEAHTPFNGILEMANHKQQAFKDDQRGFLHFGPTFHLKTLVQEMNSYKLQYLNEIWYDMGLTSIHETAVTTFPRAFGAYFGSYKRGILHSSI